MREKYIVVNCIPCGRQKVTEEEFFGGMEYCRRCCDMTTHMKDEDGTNQIRREKQPLVMVKMITNKNV